jgi:DNA-binding Lrp family transcriptional regulator
MSRWQLLVNPSFFGFRILDMVVRVQPESGKADMIRKIKLVHGVFAIQNFHGKGLKILLMYDSELARSRAVELISRITNAEEITTAGMALPRSSTKRLTGTDLAIIKAVSGDARKPAAAVAKELGLSSRTVRNRVKKLREENTLFALANLNLDGISGSIPVYLSYTYANEEAKGSVDRAILSRFDPNYLWGGFADREHGYVVLSTSTMADVKKFLDWTKEQPGIASAEVDMMTELTYVPQTFKELLDSKRIEAASSAKQGPLWT